MLPENVRKERSGWRDQEISERHRAYGFNCPCVDLDFVVVEYSVGKPVAIVEYKHRGARSPDLQHPTYCALRRLADGYNAGPLPFLLAFYRKDIWAYKVTPVNAEAGKWFKPDEVVSEREYVSRLYKMRDLMLKDSVLPHLFDVLPQDGVAA